MAEATAAVEAGSMVAAVEASAAADFLVVVLHVRTAAVRLVECIAVVAHIEVADPIALQRLAPLLGEPAVIPTGQAPVPIDLPVAPPALGKSPATVNGIPLGRRTPSVRVEAQPPPQAALPVDDPRLLAAEPSAVSVAPVSAVVSVGVLDSVLVSQRSAAGLVLVVSDLDSVGDLVGDWDLAGVRAGAARGPGIHSVLVRLERMRLTAATTTIRPIPTGILQASATTRIMVLAVRVTTQTIRHRRRNNLLARLVRMRPILIRTSRIPIGTPA
jgi:hypothetical protein